MPNASQLRVRAVSAPQELDDVMDMRRMVEQESPTLEGLVDSLTKADGYLGLNGALMVFVTAIMETLQLRAEDTEASWSNLVNGGLTVLGVALDWKSALGWLSLALFTVDMAGENDSEDRRAAMERFRDSEAARPIGIALEASSQMEWPDWGGLALSRDFRKK